MEREVATQAAPAYRELAASLHKAGFSALFGLMGEDIAGLVTALAERGARYVAARHETTAVSMAAGYASATGSVALCVVGRGPGLLNALAAAASADRAGTPLLLVSGDAPPGSTPATDLKAMDQLAAAAAAGLAALRPATATELPVALDEALALATAGRAVLLSVPLDVLEAPAELTPPAPRPRPHEPAAPDAAALDELAARVRAARRKLLLAGAGAVRAGAAPSIEALAARLPALLGTTLAAKDGFAGHPDDVGIVGGFSDPVARAQLEDVDLVVAFGAGLNRFTTAALPDGDVVQIDAEPSRLGLLRPVVQGIHGDARLAAEGLLARLPSAPAQRPWRSALAARDPRDRDLEGRVTLRRRAA